MTSTAREQVQVAIEAMTAAISSTTAHVASEAREPGSNVDSSDELMADGKKLVGRLRSIRMDLENLEFVEYL